MNRIEQALRDLRLRSKGYVPASASLLNDLVWKPIEKGGRKPDRNGRMSEHYDPSIPSEDRARFVEWFSINWRDNPWFPPELEQEELEADRKAKS